MVHLNQLDRIKVYRYIEAVRGPRNSLLTLIIKKETQISQVLDGIERRVQAIKHDNKRRQILRSLSLIKHDSSLPSQSEFGYIFCAGWSLLGKPFYFRCLFDDLSTDSKSIEVSNYEYYYDYTFEMSRIKQLFWYNVWAINKGGLPLVQSILKEIKEGLQAQSTLVFGPEEVEEAFQQSLLKCLVLRDCDVSPEDLERYLESGVALISSQDLELDSELQTILPCGLKWG